MRILTGIFALIPFLTVGAVARPNYENLAIDGGVMLIDWRGEFTAAQRDKLRDWLGTVGEAMTLLHGSLPRERIRMELTAYGTSGEAVPFGRVKRNEPQGVEFFVNPARPLSDFVTDWTAYHELSHLFIPYPGRPDVWFSEGLATYYQNVLQYRAGLLTEPQAWQKLYEGFERGRADDRDGDLTLGQLSPRMRQRRAYMRVYWSGTLYFLEADIALRSNASAAMTMDDVLKAFGDCCLHRERRWDGAAIAAEFDRIAGVDVFLTLYQRYEATRALPDYLPHLRAAGVDISNGAATVVTPGFMHAQRADAGTQNLAKTKG
jgi:hypothetical protein